MLQSEVVNKTLINFKHRMQSCKVLLYKQLSPVVFSHRQTARSSVRKLLFLGEERTVGR